MANPRHFGAIRKLPSGRWQARYRGPDGVLRPAPETFERKGDAARWLAEIETDIMKGEWRDPDRAEQLVTEYAETWIKERLGLRPRTIELYEGLLRRQIAPCFTGVTLAKIDNNPAAIRAWRAALLSAGVSVSVSAKAYRLLRAVLHTAVDDDVIRRNPCRIKGADQEHTEERPTLTPGQVAALARRMPPRLVALVMLATYASLRWVSWRRCAASTWTSTRQPSGWSGPKSRCPARSARDPPSPGPAAGWSPSRRRWSRCSASTSRST
jgi:hypothetical protein